MKTMDLISLELINFKGARKLFIDFKKDTSIFGDNATLKTTVFDSFKWLFTGKDSSDRADFNIKTLDGDNQTILGLNHSVEAKLNIDGSIKVYKKVHTENWTKPRGQAKEVLTGNTNKFFINEVPKQENEFKKEVAEFAEDMLFKMLTDPLYFSQTLKWEKRREIIFAINKTLPSNEEVVHSLPELFPLMEQFKTIPKIDDLRKVLNNRRTEYNKTLITIPPRIDENNNLIKELDFASIRLKLARKERRLNEIENELQSNVVKPDPVRLEKIERLQTLQTEVSNIKIQSDTQFNKDLNELKSSLSNKESLYKSIPTNMQKNKDRVATLKSERIELDKKLEGCRDQYKKAQEETLTIADGLLKCPTCMRFLDASNIEKKKQELHENFNSDKVKKLKTISANENDLVNEIATNETNIKSFTQNITEAEEQSKILDQEIVSLKAQISISIVQYPDLYNELTVQATKLETELLADVPISNEATTIQLNEEKKTIQTEIDSLKLDLNQEKTNEELKTRIQELSDQERELSSKIVETEGLEFLCDKFIKQQVYLIEDSINSRFKFVKFKMFKKNMNGGIEPCCEVLLNGVPFLDVNHGGKVNAGLDVIQTLSDFYRISLPVFVDNAEAVIKLLPIDSQTIKLIAEKIYTDGNTLFRLEEVIEYARSNQLSAEYQNGEKDIIWLRDVSKGVVKALTTTKELKVEYAN